MDLDYSAEERAFRDEVGGWIRAHLPAELRDKVERFEPLEKADVLRWHRILAARGWIAPHWPEAWGGTGWNVVQRYIFEEECGAAGAPQLPGLALAFCAPVLIRYGTPAQKQRFLPRIYHGDEFWCQGYSEPGAGSDLAALRTRARRDGDGYVIDGHKIWTTQAEWADWMFALARTGDGGRPQEGISVFLIDMRAAGVRVRPLPLMDGGYEVNEVFLDSVRVPADARVHEEGQGWTVAKYLLGYERMNNARVGIAKRTLAAVRRLAAAQPAAGSRCLLDDPRFRDRLSRVEVELTALEITNLRYLDRQRRTGVPPGAEVSLLKIKGSEIHQALAELAMQASASGSADDPVAARYLNLRKLSIYGGTNEVQRNILAKATLGL